MSELQDLKNYILAIQEKINNLTIILTTHSKKDDNLNEILNLIHNQNFEKSRFNSSLFENVFPDIIRRISAIENQLSKSHRIDIDKERILNTLIEDTNLSTRIKRSLISLGITTVRKICEFSEYDILKVPNLARVSLGEIVSFLAENSLELRKVA